MIMRWSVRIGMTIALPFILLWIVFERLAKGMRLAVSLAWSDLRENWREYRNIWTDTEDWISRVRIKQKREGT